MTLKKLAKKLLTEIRAGIAGQEVYVCEDCGEAFETDRELFLHRVENHR